MDKEKVTGTLGFEERLKQEQVIKRYDNAGKKLLSYKEVLATILKYSISEYEQYTCEEIMGFIDTDSISNDMPIEPDSDTRIIGDNTEQSSMNEAKITFDVKFRVIKPAVKNIHLHVDVELQGDYYPGYPLEKRGIYNLSRMISSQRDTIHAKTNYDKLEKAYCIFICVGRLPKYLWNTASYYEFVNTKNIGVVENAHEKYDLMGLVILRIGSKITPEVADIIHFLHGLFYEPAEVEEYIDFSQNEEFRKELTSMGIGQYLVEYGREEEREELQEKMRRLEEERKEAESGRKRAEEERIKSESERKKAEEERIKADKKAEEERKKSEEKIKNMAQALIDEGISIQRIAQITGSSQGEIQKLMESSDKM